MKKICWITTSPLIVNFFLTPHLLRLARRHDVSLAVAQPGEVPLLPLPGVRVVPLEIARPIRPVHDLITLFRLSLLMRGERFDLVHSFAPKAGLLACFAGAIAKVPARLHTFTGQVWASRKGPARALLRAADRCTASMATHLFADSRSQKRFLVEEGVLRATRCEVLGDGSISGVDLRRFRPDATLRRRIREEIGVRDQCALILFLGRLTRDKGVLDLAAAFAALPEGIDAHLLLVGPDEERLFAQIREGAGRRGNQVSYVPYTTSPELYLAAADMLSLPSYREGFGTVIIEAAAAGVPAIASRIYGVIDAVVDGSTGFLHEPGNVADLAHKLGLVVENETLRRALGEAALRRVRELFSQERLVDALQKRYDEILSTGR